MFAARSVALYFPPPVPRFVSSYICGDLGVALWIESCVPCLTESNSWKYDAYQHSLPLKHDTRLGAARGGSEAPWQAPCRRLPSVDAGNAASCFQRHQVDHFAHFGSRFKVVIAGAESSNGGQSLREADARQTRDEQKKLHAPIVIGLPGRCHGTR